MNFLRDTGLRFIFSIRIFITFRRIIPFKPHVLKIAGQQHIILGESYRSSLIGVEQLRHSLVLRGKLAVNLLFALIAPSRFYVNFNRSLRLVLYFPWFQRLSDFWCPSVTGGQRFKFRIGIIGSIYFAGTEIVNLHNIPLSVYKSSRHTYRSTRQSAPFHSLQRYLHSQDQFAAALEKIL